MIYRFGSFTLDVESHLLTRAGEVVPVEPRVFDLLRALVRRPRVLVTKDDLMEEVWDGRIVSEGAVSRCVYEARAALGDPGRHGLIETVHGKGFRFNADVETVEAAQHSTAPEGLPVPAVRARRGARLAWALGLGLLGALLTVTAWRFVPERSATRAMVAETGLPVIQPVRPTIAEPDPELRLLALSVADLLSRRLRGLPEVVVRDPVDADSLPGAPESAATFLLEGSLRRSGDRRVLVELELRSPDGVPTPLGPYDLPTLTAAPGLEDFMDLRERVVSRVLRRVAPLVDAAEGGRWMGADVEAYRLYLTALEPLTRGDFCAGSRAAVPLLERAVRLAPTFGEAWDLLGWAWYNHVWACGEDSAYLERAIAASATAREVAPHLRQPAMRLVALLIETGRVEEAWSTLEVEINERPDDPMLRTLEATALRYAGFLERSRTAVTRALRADPLVYSTRAFGGTPLTLLYQGDVTAFAQLLPPGDATYRRFYRGQAALRNGDAEAALELFAAAYRSDPNAVFGRLARANMAVLDGAPEVAVEVVRSLAEQRRQLGNRDGEITFKQAQIYALAGAPDEALDELRNTVQQGFFCVECFAGTPAFESLRERAEFDDVMGDATARHRRFAERFGLPTES